MAIFTGSSVEVQGAVNARMQRSLAKFAGQVNKFADDRVPEEVVIIQRKISLEALNRVVLKTPVATGRARGNWQLSVGAAKQGEKKEPASGLGSASPPQQGQADLALLQAAQEELRALGPFQAVYIVNNVHYTIWLENGTSKQAPQGMVAITLEELMQMFA